MALFPPLFAAIPDPRQANKVFYPQAALFFAGILSFVCRLGARRQITYLLRNTSSRALFRTLFGVDAFPHGDTVEGFFQRVEPDLAQEVVSSLTERLIRQKILSPFRFLGHYYVVAIDGTGMLSFPKRHCPHCLTRKNKGKIQYYHPVLEAKILLPNGFAFSLMTEFIENPEETPDKQDCELKAFYRLADRLKKRFPRLPICLSLDGLYAGGPTFALCERYHWKYMIVLQDDSLPSVNREFSRLSPLTLGNTASERSGPKLSIQRHFEWVNDILYADTQNREHVLSVLECRETKPDRNREIKTTTFRWVTNLSVTEKNVRELHSYGGRIRWKIENEGFNVQKNGGFGLEHAYSRHPTASKIYYLLLQIAHLFIQLLEKSSLLRKAFPKGFGSVKNLSFRILEAWRNVWFPPGAIELLSTRRIQIRFDSS